MLSPAEFSLLESEVSTEEKYSNVITSTVADISPAWKAGERDSYLDCNDLMPLRNELRELGRQLS